MTHTTEADMTPNTNPCCPPLHDGSGAPVQPEEASHRVEVFFDGDCPLCSREISMLRRLDRKRRIRFTDIASEDFSAEAIGADMDALMAGIHARLPDGSWIEGVEVFRRLYSAVGLWWMMWITRLPVVSHVLELGYRIFARNRLKWTGRCGHDAARCTLDHPRA